MSTPWVKCSRIGGAAKRTRPVTAATASGGGAWVGPPTPLSTTWCAPTSGTYLASWVATSVARNVSSAIGAASTAVSTATAATTLLRSCSSRCRPNLSRAPLVGSHLSTAPIRSGEASSTATPANPVNTMAFTVVSRPTAWNTSTPQAMIATHRRTSVTASADTVRHGRSAATASRQAAAVTSSRWATGDHRPGNPCGGSTRHRWVIGRTTRPSAMPAGTPSKVEIIVHATVAEPTPATARNRLMPSDTSTSTVRVDLRRVSPTIVSTDSSGSASAGIR
jgi:hypothetical protein